MPGAGYRAREARGCRWTKGGEVAHPEAKQKLLLVVIRPGHVAWLLTGLTLAFGALGLVAEYLSANGHPVAIGFANFFDPAREGSLPEWFSATIDGLGACAVLLVALAEPHGSLRWRWCLLALLMAGLSAGEATAILDARLPVLDLLHVEPGIATGWVMRGGGAVVFLILLALLVPIFGVVGRRRSMLALGCGALVILGQSGLGWLGGRLAVAYGHADLRSLLAHVGEETFETWGAALFLALVLEYMMTSGGLVLRHPGSEV